MPKYFCKNLKKITDGLKLSYVCSKTNKLCPKIRYGYNAEPIPNIYFTSFGCKILDDEKNENKEVEEVKVEKIEEIKEVKVEEPIKKELPKTDISKEINESKKEETKEITGKKPNNKKKKNNKK